MATGHDRVFHLDMTATNVVDSTAPTVTSIGDDVYGGPIWEDITPVTFTLHFDEDIDESTVDATDFENAGSGVSFTVGTITKITPTNAPAQVTVAVNPSGSGTLQLQIKSGAVITDTAGNPLDTSSAIPDATTITVNAGNAPATVITGTAGGNNSWNNDGNWSVNRPYGNFASVISNGVLAAVDNGSETPVYSGGLAISNNATLRVGYGNPVLSEELNALGTGTITMYTGAKIVLRYQAAVTMAQAISLQGAAQVDGTSSTTAHHQPRTFSGGFSGPGSITFWSGNNNTFNLNAASTHSGGTTVTSGNCHLAANANGALGTGNVYIENASSLVIAGSLSDTIDNSAALHLNGAKDSGQAAKLVLNSSETVFQLWIDGVQQPGGTYNSSESFISGGGTLTVTDSPLSITNSGAVNVLHDSADLVGELYGPSDTYDLYLYWGENNNADGAAWLADGTASSTDLGSFNDYRNVSMTGSVSGLTPSTTYYYTMLATNATKHAWASPNATFDSLPPPAPPSAGTNVGATAQVAGGATLNGELTGGGSADGWICWGGSDAGTSTGAWENVVSMGTVVEAVPFSTDVSGLLYGNTYAYRVYVSNISGSGWSDAATFAPAAPEPSAGVSIAIYREAAAGDAFTTADFDHAWDTTVRDDGDDHTLNANGINVECAAGHHLVLHSARFDRSSANGNRTEGQSCLVLAGTELRYGWGQGYTRYDNGDLEMIINGGTIVDVANDGDALRLRSYRTDNNAAAQMTQVADAAGLQLIKLDDDWDYCRLAKSGDVAGPVNATFVPVSYDAVDELDTGSFGHSGEDITLKTAGHYLVLANTYFHSSSGSSRSGYNQRLSLGDGTTQTYLDGSRTWVYVRGNESTQEGAASLGMIIETTSANEVLNVEANKETGQNPTIRAFGTGVTIVKLPDDGDYVRLDGPADDFNPSSETAQTWDTRHELDAAFTHSGSASTVTVNEDDDYLFTTALWDDDDGSGRGKPWQRWRVNGTDTKKYAGMGRYSRNSGTQDTGNWSGIALGMSAADTIEVVSVALGNSGSNTADHKHLTGVRLGSIASAGAIIAVTHATNILSSTADLQGTLNGPDAVFTVTAFWSESNNVASAEWLGDTTASSDVIGTFSNQSAYAVNGSASSLSAGTTYYYTLRAHNAFTNHWTATNATFDTLAPLAPPLAGLNGGATGIGIGTATLRGVMTNAAAADAYICWGDDDGGTSGTGSWDNVISIGVVSDGVGFSNVLSGLYYGIGYDYRVYVTNDASNAWSAVGTFATLPPAGGAPGEQISYHQITSDADSEIGSGSTYTHALDFGSSGAATVNGVAFATDVNVAAGGRSNSGTRTYGPNNHGGNTPPGVSGSIASVFQDMRYNGPDLGYVELTGLTEGTWYDVRLYDRAWDYNGAIRTYYAGYDVGGDGSVEFTTQKVDQNRATLNPPGLSGNVSWAMSHVYQADASGTMRVIIDLADDQTGTYHIYGLTNEELLPVASLGLDNTSATNVGARAAQLGGTLQATGSVFDVYVYWGTNDNADSAAWIGDGTASNQLVGTYTNVMDQSLLASVSGLDPLTTYYYTMRAVNEATNLWASPNVSFTTYDTLAITNIAASGVTGEAATLTGRLLVAGTSAAVRVYWGDNNGGINPGSWDTNALVGTWTNVINTNISYAVSGLSSEQTYYYTFRASNTADNAWASPSHSFLTQLGSGQTPVFTSTDGTWKGADLDWADNANAETGYILRRSTAGAGGPYTVIATLAADTTSYSDTSASPVTTYWYQLAATSSVSQSSTDFTACQTSVTTDAKPYAQLGILNVDHDSGINPATGAPWAEGDTYRLAFVSIETNLADSTFIDDYNTFIQNVANNSAAFPNLGDVTWKVIGSTAFVDARDNTETNPNEDGTGEAIFLLNGTTRIANDYADLWDNSIDNELRITEENTVRDTDTAVFGNWVGTWTGTGTAGTKGNPLGGGTSVTFGLARGGTTGHWVNRGSSDGTLHALPFYGLSEPLTLRGLITVVNQAATDVASTSATVNAELLIPITNADVTVYWGPTDGGTIPGSWSTNAYVGSWTNLSSTNISHVISGLTSGQTYHYTFYASNSGGAENWASPSLSFTALASPVVDNAGGATAVLDTSATLRGNMSTGGLATAYIVWGGSIPGSPESTGAWANVESIGSVTDNSVFTHSITGLTSETTYYYRCFVTNAIAGAWSPVTNFTTLSVVNTMTAGGADDSWNTGGNWSLTHVVTGTENAVVDTGLYADVNNASTPAYSGSLTLNANATMRVRNNTAATVAFGDAAKTITMNANSGFVMGTGNYTWSQPIALAGNARVTGGYSTTAHHTSRSFNGAISGPGQLTFNGVNNNTFNLNAASTFDGLVAYSSQNQGFRVEANAGGACGSGDVTIQAYATLQVDAADVMDDSAVLSFNGTRDSRKASKLVMNANDTVYQLFIDGVQQDGGPLTSASGLTDIDSVNLISGGGTLTVIDWPAYITNNSAVNVDIASADLVGTLDAINETFDVYVYWGTNDNASSAAWLTDGTASNTLIGSYSDEASVTGSVSSLSSLTTYYYTMMASNAVEGRIWASPNASFSTPGPPTAPTVTTGGGAANIDIGGATLRGLLTAGGQGNAWICYGTTDGGTGSTGDWDNVASVGAVIEGFAFSNNVSGLLYGIEYDYRVYVENVADSDWSELATFMTTWPSTDPMLTVTGNLEAHYAANAGASVNGSSVVTNWADQSGNGKDLIVDAGTPTLTQNEINGLPAINFNANGEGLRLADLGDEYFSKETWLVFRSSNGGTKFSGWSAPFGPLDQGDNNDRSWMFENNTARFWNGEPPAAVNHNGTVIPNGGDNRYDMSSVGSMGEFMVLRVVTGSGSGTQPRAYAVGTRNDQWASGRYMTAEVIAYNSTNTTANQEQIGAYLADKYALDTTYAEFYQAADLGPTNTAADNVTSSAADLEGILNATQSVFTAYVYYSENNNADTAAWLADGTATKVLVGSYTNVDDVPLSESVSGLSDNTTYYYTMMASNDATIIWASPNATFDTLSAAVAPTVTNNGGATNVGVATATLRGLLTAGVFADAYICYGVSDGGTGNTSAWDNVVSVGVASDGVAFSNNVSGLLYGIEYNYRVYVTNAADHDWSGLDTFTTLAPPPGASGMVAPGSLTVTCSDDWNDRLEIDAFNGVGLVTSNTHNSTAGDMWLSNGGVANEWIKVALGSTYDLDYLRVWNYNESGGTYVNRGVNQCDIYVASTDPGVNVDDSGAAFNATGWTLAKNNQIFTKSPGGTITNTDAQVDLGGVSAAYLAIRVDSNHGGDNYVGLSEVQIYYSTPESIGIVNAAASNITDAAADLYGTLDSTGAVFDVYVYWSTTSNANAAAWLADGTASNMLVGAYTNVADQSVAASVSSLNPLTTYYYTFMATNAATNIWATPNLSFTTYAVQVAPTVDNDGGATAVLDTTATLNGNMSVGGLANAYIVWGGSIPGSPDSTSAWANVESIGSVGNNAPFSVGISGLTAETTYHYRCYVTNSVDDAWSSVTNFTTTETVNLMTAGGSSDSWNSGGNWSLTHVPTGAENAIVDTGIYADVNNAATPAYTGTLTLRANATMRVQSGTSPISRPFGGAAKTITLNAGSGIVMGTGNHTWSQPIELAGNARVTGGYSTTAHHTSRSFNGAISGAGQLTFNGVNNNTFHLNAANSFDGLVAFSSQNQGFRVEANATGACGAGDVTIQTNVTLQVDAADVIADTAILTLNGVRDSRKTGKLVLNADETVDKFFIDGIQKDAGTYDSGSGLIDAGGNPLIAGSFTLTVVTGPPVVPPSLTSIEDNVYGGPIWEDFGADVVYTVTFDRDMDDTTVSSNDFENGGTASIAVGAVNETFDGVFSVAVTPSSAGTLILQIKAGANLESSVGGVLDTTNALPDDTTITILAGSTPDTTITGTAGGNDSWNESSNWDYGVPFGPQNAIVSNGVAAHVESAPPVYTGDLTLLGNASLYLRTGSAKAVIPSAPQVLTLHGGSTLYPFGNFGGGSLTFGPVVLAGAATISGGSADRSTYTFADTVSGSGGVTLWADNRNKLIFTAASTFSGGVTVGNAGNYVKASSDGALGTGNVTINDAASLWIAAGLSDTIGDRATVYLNGTASSELASKVVLDSTETVSGLFFEGVQQDPGVWGAVGSGARHEDARFTGSGFLIVTPPGPTLFILR